MKTPFGERPMRDDEVLDFARALVWLHMTDEELDRYMKYHTDHYTFEEKEKILATIHVHKEQWLDEEGDDFDHLEEPTCGICLRPYDECTCAQDGRR